MKKLSWELSVESQAKSLALLLLLFFGVAHFSMTLAYCLPATPLTTQYYAHIKSWIYPYLTQNWSFFAPNPPNKDDYVLVQYRYQNPSGQVVDGPWINLSRTFNTACQQNRLSSLEIIQLMTSNAYSEATRSAIFKDGKIDNEVLVKEFSSGQLPSSFRALVRTGMAYFPKAGIEGTPLSLRLAFLHHEFPRYTHRDEPDPQDEHNEITTFPFVPFEQVTSY